MDEQLKKDFIDLSNENKIEEDNKLTPIEVEWNPERDKIKLARQVLAGLALIFLIGIACEIYSPQSPVFEACKNIIPSMAAFIIGYYFAKS